MSNKPPEEKFRENMVDLTAFIGDLFEFCENEGKPIMDKSLLVIGKNLLSQMNSKELLNLFIKYTFPYWNEIHTRNMDFFLNHGAEILRFLPIGDINLFKLLFDAKDRNEKPILTEDDIELLWSYFSSMIRLSIKYIHQERNIQFIQTEQGLKPKYQKSFMPTIKVREWADKFEVNLDRLTPNTVN